MTRKTASILVIGAFPEDERMYPHLHDILVNLRAAYDEVIYVGDDPQYRHHLELDTFIMYSGYTDDPGEQTVLNHIIKDKAIHLKSTCASFIEKLRGIPLRNARRMVLAIDDNAFNAAMAVFPDSTIYWSFDPLGRDCPYRPEVDGFVERMIRESALNAHHALALVVQDRSRERHLLDCLGTTFFKTIYVPVALNDSTYCKISALKRAHAGNPSIMKVVQSGHICVGRYSDEIARSYQGWPDMFELSFRGNIDESVYSMVKEQTRPIHLAAEFYDNRVLPAILNNYDAGFIGYRETDRNHQLIVNASSQLVAYLRMGMPVICCGSESLVAFVRDHGIGCAACHPVDLSAKCVAELAENYAWYSANARALFESRYDLQRYMADQLYPELDLMLDKNPS